MQIIISKKNIDFLTNKNHEKNVYNIDLTYMRNLWNWFAFVKNVKISFKLFFAIAVADPNKPHDDHSAEPEQKPSNVYTDKALEETIDYVLKSMDLNNDGYVDYAEYRKTEANVGKD